MAKMESIEFEGAGRFLKGRRGCAPSMVVVHWSAGWGDAEEIAAYFKNPMTTGVVKDAEGRVVLDPETGEPKTITKPRQASYHFAIGRDGTVIQLVDTANTAWHAGGGTDFEGRGRINERSIGVCLANRGPVKSSPKWMAAHPDRVYTGPHPKPGFKGYGTKFEDYTAEQFKALAELLPRLIAEHPTLTTLLGHEDLVHGKGDPGPCFGELRMDWAALGLTRQVKDWSTGLWHTGGAIDA